MLKQYEDIKIYISKGGITQINHMPNTVRRFESQIQVGCIFTLLPYEVFLVIYM